MKYSILVTMVTLLLFGCTKNPALTGDGGATETVNAQVIIADTTVTVKINSDNLVNADLMFLDTVYNPAYNTGNKVSFLINTKDTTVMIKFKPGFYNMLIHQKDRNKSLAVKNLKLCIGAQRVFKDTLSPDGAIKGKIVSASLSNDKSVYYKLYIPGTPFFTEVYDGNFEISGIPEGIYYLEISMCSVNKYSDKSYSKLLGRDIEVKSNVITSGIDLFVSN